MSGKAAAVPTRSTVVDEDNVLWMIAVHSTLQEEYSCEYKSEDHRWRVHVQSSTLAGAADLVEQCRHTLGLDREENYRRTLRLCAEHGMICLEYYQRHGVSRYSAELAAKAGETM